MLKLNTENDEKALAIELSNETIEACKAVNNTLNTAGVSPFFQAHYANAKLDVHGIMRLVRKILREREAVFGRGIENTELRQIAIAHSMFTDEILAQVEKEFSAGGGRYKLQAVKNCLSTYGKKDGTIGRIKLSNEEDRPRLSDKPRFKWYLIAKQDE